MRWFFSFFLLTMLLMPVAVFADAQTGKCAGGDTAVVDKTEAGMFLQGVCTECWSEGNCSLSDFMTAIANTGNFILSIIAGLVFLVYIMGGFFWIIAHGDKGLVEKGKKWIKNATIGLVIVLVAYTGVVALRSMISGEGLSSGYIICDGSEASIDQPCGLNQFCAESGCVSLCDIYSSVSGTEELSWECKDTSTTSKSGCIPNYCPGDENFQCCPKTK